MLSQPPLWFILIAFVASSAATFDPAKAVSFPADTVVSEFTAPRWSSDGERLLVGQRQAVSRGEPGQDRIVAALRIRGAALLLLRLGKTLEGLFPDHPAQTAQRRCRSHGAVRSHHR